MFLRIAPYHIFATFPLKNIPRCPVVGCVTIAIVLLFAFRFSISPHSIGIQD